jgi:hypothetical protein
MEQLRSAAAKISSRSRGPFSHCHSQEIDSEVKSAGEVCLDDRKLTQRPSEHGHIIKFRLSDG